MLEKLFKKLVGRGSSFHPLPLSIAASRYEWVWEQLPIPTPPLGWEELGWEEGKSFLKRKENFFGLPADVPVFGWISPLPHTNEQ